MPIGVFSEKLGRIGFDMDALKATGAAKYSRPGTRPSPALSGVGPEAETWEHKGVDSSGITHERCELIHVLYTISYAHPSPLDLCGVGDNDMCATRLIIFKSESPKTPCRALPAIQPRQAITYSIQMHKPTRHTSLASQTRRPVK